jgi:ABC-type Fe3+ transport system substrate-binding protein
VVNSTLVDPKSVASWNDFLKPEYKGKIASYDPRPAGAGQALAGYLVHTFGMDYLKKLYFGQDVITTRDGRQLVEWGVRGAYSIILASIPVDIERFRAREGSSIAPLDLLDGPGLLTGGFSIVKQLKDVPHPNAATVFINWFASRPGQEAYASATLEPSRRSDVTIDAIPAYVIPKPGLAYLDQFTEDFYVRIRPQLQKDVVEAFGGR